MFDNRFAEFCPGLLTEVGWPWHGFVSMAGNGSMKLNTPKEQIDLKRTSNTYPYPPSVHKFFQLGTVLRFRDSRAADVVRTPEQLAEDSEKGVEWRADVLFNPHEAILHGKTRSSRGYTQWLYHDGQKNWLVEINYNSTGGGWLYFTEMLFVAGDNHSDTSRYASFPQGDYSKLRQQGCVLMDATRDGSRVLFAFYTSDNLEGEDPTSILELTIEKLPSQPQFRTYLTEIYDSDSLLIKRDIIEDEMVMVQPAMVVSHFEKTESPSENGYDYVVSAELDYSIEHTTEAVANTPYPIKNINYLTEQERIVGAYYDDSGTIKFITIHSVEEDRWTGTVNGVPRQPLGGSGENESGTTLGHHSFEVDLYGSLTGQRVITVELRADGEPKTTVVFTETAETNYSYMQHGSLRVPYYGSPDAWLDDQIIYANETQSDSNFIYSAEIDGVEAFTKTGAYSSSSALTVLVAWQYTSIRLTQGFVSRGGYRSSFHAGAELKTTRYAALAPCISVYLKKGSNNIEISDEYLSKICAPFGDDLQTEPAYRDRSTNQLLFGSWNPLTGEIIRDSLTPVFWM